MAPVVILAVVAGLVLWKSGKLGKPVTSSDTTAPLNVAAAGGGGQARIPASDLFNSNGQLGGREAPSASLPLSPNTGMDIVIRAYDPVPYEIFPGSDETVRNPSGEFFTDVPVTRAVAAPVASVTAVPKVAGAPTPITKRTTAVLS